MKNRLNGWLSFLALTALATACGGESAKLARGDAANPGAPDGAAPAGGAVSPDAPISLGGTWPAGGATGGVMATGGALATTGLIGGSVNLPGGSLAAGATAPVAGTTPLAGSIPNVGGATINGGATATGAMPSTNSVAGGSSAKSGGLSTAGISSGLGGTSAVGGTSGGQAGAGGSTSTSTVPQVCKPRGTSCDAAKRILTTCSADGSQLSNTDCSTFGQICSSGACRSVVCPPGVQYCDGNSVSTCAADGLSATPNYSCGTGAYCDPVTTSCKQGICAPGLTACTGSTITTCNAEGSGFTNVGLDCSTVPQARCVNATCVCPPGLANCDGVAGTPCETDIATNTANCGGCGLACSANHTTDVSCAAGECKAKCEAHFANCNDDMQFDGCEADLRTDINNCSGCQWKCSASHITPKCIDSQCKGDCDPGYADCNSDKLKDGCETEIENNPAACGGCMGCSTQNMAVTTCLARVCNGVCAAGFADCNNDKQTDGCEIEISSDANNCGGCGRVCPTGEVCVNSQCSRCNPRVVSLNGSAFVDYIVARLETEGLTDTDFGLSSYSGSNPLDRYGAVLLIVGDATKDMPATGQAAIVAAQAAGTGVVILEPASTLVPVGKWSTLAPLLLIGSTTMVSTTNGWAIQQATSHPLWTGLPASFQQGTSLPMWTAGTVINDGTAIANWMCSSASCSASTGPAVVIKDSTSAGRIVHITHTSSYQKADWLKNTTLLKLFANAAKWAAHCLE